MNATANSSDGAQLSRYQALLIEALTARTHAVEQCVGDRYGFEIQRAGATTAFLAHTWPRVTVGLPFNRVFDYVASNEHDQQIVLSSLPNEIIIEVLPGAHTAATERELHQHSFTPRWRIPWLHIALDQPPPRPLLAVRQVAPDELDAFASLLIAGYNYSGEQAHAWHDLARYGYGAPGFACFVAEAEQPIAAGVVYIRDRLALVDGAATLTQQRGRGAQTALLLARLAFARSQGCTHAVSRTGADSTSQRNMQQLGLHIIAHSQAWMRYNRATYA